MTMTKANTKSKVKSQELEVAHEPGVSQEGEFRAGVELIRKQWLDAMSKLGLTPIPAKGEPCLFARKQWETRWPASIQALALCLKSGARGTSAVTLVPRPGWLFTVTLPPKRRARSRMLLKPKLR